MRIALVYPHMTFAVPEAHVCDALAIVNYEIARRLAADHQVTVFVGRAGNQPQQQVHEGVAWYRISVDLDRALCSLKFLDDTGLTAPARPFHVSGLYYANYARGVAREIRARECEIAHVHTVTQLLPAIHRESPQTRLVFHAHDHSLVDFDASVLRERLKHAALILACSTTLADKIAGRFPELADRCHGLHNGVDQRFLDTPANPARSQEVLFVGRLSPEKGVHVLLEAFRRIASRFPRACLHLVGPRSFAPQQFVDPFGRDPKTVAIRPFYRDTRRYMDAVLRNIAALDGRVRCEGCIPNGAMTQRYASAGIFVFPSIWDEPFGIPIIEAMAAGLPVITTRGGAASEIVVDGETGLLVERGDPDALERALEALLSDPGSRIRMGAAARERVAKMFTWDRAVSELVGHYGRMFAPQSSWRAADRHATSELQLARRFDDAQ